MIDSKQLIEELRSLEGQREAQRETLLQIDGAISMIHHLLERDRRGQQEAKQDSPVNPEMN